MQTNLPLVHADQPVVLALGQTRSLRTRYPAAGSHPIPVTTELRRGQAWEDFVWLLVAAASAGVLFMSLTCLGRMW